MKKYTHRDQIIRDIDAAHRKIKKAKEAAQGFLDEEELLTGTGNVVDLRAAREAADKEFRKIKYQQDKRLKPLGEKLAEMDTIPLAMPPQTLPESPSCTASTPPTPPAA